MTDFVDFVGGLTNKGTLAGTETAYIVDTTSKKTTISAISTYTLAALALAGTYQAAAANLDDWSGAAVADYYTSAQVDAAFQPLDADLTTLAGLAKTKGNIIAANGTSWAALGVGTDGQVLTADAASANGVKWATPSGGGGTPGGSNTQLQYNNSGSFGGISALTWDGTSLTLSGAPLVISGNQSAAAWTTNGIRIKGSAGTLTDTSSSGTVAAAYTNVLGGDTIAASSATTYTTYASLFVSEPTAGANVTMTEKWALSATGGARISGNVRTGGTLVVTDNIASTNTGNEIVFTPSSGVPTFVMKNGFNNFVEIGRRFSTAFETGIGLSGASHLGWTSGSATVTASDVRLYRDAANTLALRNSTNAQTLRVYNTYTDSSNGEWGFIRWSSNVLEFGNDFNGTGSARIPTIKAKVASGAFTAQINFTFDNNGGASSTTLGLFNNSGTAYQFILAGATEGAFQRTGSGMHYVTKAGGSFGFNDTVTNAPDTRVTRVAAAVIGVRGNSSTAAGTLSITTSTVAALVATPAAGYIAAVSDANAPSIGSTVAGGGAAFALVCYNGSAWTVIGV